MSAGRDGRAAEPPLPTPPAAVLFDLDGTLADSMVSIAEALADTLARHGHDVAAKALTAQFGPPMQDVIRAVAPVGAAEANRIYAEFMPRYYEEYMPRTRTLPGAGVLLGDLAEAGLPLAIVTSKIERGARALIGRLGWTERFAVVVGRDTAPEQKPSPAPVRHALAALGAEASRCVFVGDTEADMRAAAGAGVAAVVGLAAIRGEAGLRAAGATHVRADLEAVRRLLRPAARAAASGGAGARR